MKCNKLYFVVIKFLQNGEIDTILKSFYQKQTVQYFKIQQ